MKGSTSFQCSSSICDGITKLGTYYFIHQSCKKKLCFWCIFEIYKQQKKKISPNFKKEKLKITFPCCKTAYLLQFPTLQKFILNGCLFDGRQCKSKQKYQCVDGLKIGKECYNHFVFNQKQTKYNARMLNKISDYAFINCNNCDKYLVNITSSQYYGSQFIGFCENCMLKRVQKISMQGIKPNICYKCKEEEILDDVDTKSRKNNEFVVKKFRLTMFDENLCCLFCIYHNWQNFCLAFRQGKHNFSKLIQYIEKIQKFFVKHCLACGIQAQNDINVFELKHQSIQSPFNLNIFLCRHCHALMNGQNKITKTLQKLKIYIHQTKQQYNSIVESIIFKEFKQIVEEKMNYFCDMLEDSGLLEKQKKMYELKIAIKQANHGTKDMMKEQTTKQISKNLKKISSQNETKQKDQLSKKEKQENLNSKRQQFKGEIFGSQSRSTNKQPNLVKHIIQTKQTQEKYNTIEKTKVQQKVNAKSDSQKFHRQSTSAKEPSKNQDPKLNKLFRTSEPLHLWKGRKQLGQSKKQKKQTPSQKSMKKSESITQSEQSSVKGLTDSQKRQPSEEKNIIFQNSEYVSFEGNKEMIDRQDIMQEERHVQLKQRQRTTDVEEEPLNHSSQSGKIINSPQESISREHTEQNQFQIELNEWKLNKLNPQKPKLLDSDFDLKLRSIDNGFEGFFPQLLKDIKAQLSCKSIRPIRPKESILCHRCKKNQEEFLFLEKYCFSCFNSFLAQKIL